MMMLYVNQFLSLSITLNLLMVNQAYAVESSSTPGPSVGHRPVINGLVLGTIRGDMSQSSVPLYVGEEISRTAGTITDVDGDPTETEEFCRWYKVDPVTHSETLMASGKPCSYTLQPGDVGFKIKNEIKVISDSAVASAKGFRLNPDESWPVRTESANVVIAATPTPFPATTTLNTHLNPHVFSVNSGFPEAGFIHAEFTIQVEGDVNNNSQYEWSTDQPTWTNVDTNGIVKFTAKPSRATKTVRITASSKTNKAIVYIKDFTINRWFTNNGIVHMNWTQQNSFCSTPRRLASNGVLGGNYSAPNTITTRGTRAGALWSEWGNWSRYPGSGFEVGQYYTSEQDTSVDNYFIRSDTGFLGLIPSTGQLLVACVQDI